MSLCHHFTFSSKVTFKIHAITPFPCKCFAAEYQISAMHSAPLHILNPKNLRMIDKLKSCCGALRIILEGEIIFWSAEFGKATFIWLLSSMRKGILDIHSQVEWLCSNHSCLPAMMETWNLCRCINLWHVLEVRMLVSLLKQQVYCTS